MSTVELFWLPLGAGGRSVRLNGRVYERVLAWLGRRAPLDLYHSALVVKAPEGEFVIEMAPVRDGAGARRGVVGEGPVGSRAAGRLRLFRYEIRRWPGGFIPDVDDAVESPRRVTDDPAAARRLLELVPQVPLLVWGRDELGSGEMWNSNSVVSWLLVAAEMDADAIRPPQGGRVPGWRAGVLCARRLVPGGGEPGRVLAAKVERNAEEQCAGPEVDRVEGERLVVADERRHEPDDEPHDGHAATLLMPTRPGHPQSAAVFIRPRPRRRRLSDAPRW